MEILLCLTATAQPRSIMRLFFATVLLSATTAGAQTTSSTTCFVSGQWINCDTRTNQQNDIWGSFGVWQRQYQEIQKQNLDQFKENLEQERTKKLQNEQNQIYMQQNAQQNNAAYIRRRVAELATSGDCINAMDMASYNGEFELQRQVKTFCEEREKAKQK
ncbi:hypothetical protein [Sandarakinorhabdus sp.]|uniref:hypothetical protein n=1 Tax=Sandarakinorhabdus sp. TaxID=1916663 RepID=UPI00286DA730|nr:hypothetical protein [Sandarakinorhabdus sp.]